MHGRPRYRVVWGWQRPDIYGIGDGDDLNYFHLERWMAMDSFIDQEDWNARELALAAQYEGYRMQPYPRHGEYFAVYKPCRWGIADENGVRRAHFRAPDMKWLEGAVIHDLLRLARTREDVAEEVKESQAALKQIETAQNHRIQDDLGIRDLVETQTSALYRNPTLRKDPSLMLSPAVAMKRVRHRISNTL